MATKKVKKESTKALATVVDKETLEPISTSTVRVVLEVPSASLERFKVLCNLVGDTQSSLVTKAMDSYVSERKELIDQFIELRTKVSK